MMAGPSRRQRERERHRREVLLAAEAVFAEKEFGRATVQEIAGRAEFAVGSLYNLFESKEAIYRELIDTRMREYSDHVQESMDACEGPREKVRAVIHAKIGFFREHEPFFRMFSHAMLGGRSGQPQLISGRCAEILKGLLDRLEAVLAEGRKSGLFRDADARLMALLVEGATSGVIRDSLMAGRQWLDEDTPEQIEQLVLRGILREGRAK